MGHSLGTVITQDEQSLFWRLGSRASILDHHYIDFKRRDIILPTKIHIVKAMFFSSNCVWMWELYHKEGRVLKNLCFQIVVLEMKTLESPLDSKKIKPVNPKGDQTWVFIGRTEAEAPIPWPPNMKNQLIRKDPDSEKDLKAGGKGANRGPDRCMASLTQWSWVWANSGR